MGDLGLKQCDLATRWKKSPQYVSQLLHEDVSVNFTIETMVQLSTLVDRRLVIQVLKRNEVSQSKSPQVGSKRSVLTDQEDMDANPIAA